MAREGSRDRPPPDPPLRSLRFTPLTSERQADAPADEGIVHVLPAEPREFNPERQPQHLVLADRRPPSQPHSILNQRLDPRHRQLGGRPVVEYRVLVRQPAPTLEEHREIRIPPELEPPRRRDSEVVVVRIPVHQPRPIPHPHVRIRHIREQRTEAERPVPRPPPPPCEPHPPHAPPPHPRPSG